MKQVAIFIWLVIALALPEGFVAPGVNLDNYWCHACDDPHMLTSDQQSYEFQYQGNNYIMYTDYGTTRVTASFLLCNRIPGNPNPPMCNCGVNVKFMDAHIYLDTCGILGDPSTLQFYYYDSSNLTPTAANCDLKQVSPADETDDIWWDTPNNAQEILTNRFLCAKSDTLYNTYIIRTNDPDNDNNIFVKVMLHDRGISCTYVRPSLNVALSARFDNKTLGGLCGNANTDPSDDLFTWVSNGQPSDSSPNSGYDPTLSAVSDVESFWKLEANPPIEFDYKRLNDNDCPCDSSASGSDPNNCPTPLSICTMNTFGLPYVTQTSVHDYEGKGGDGQQQDPTVAVKTCDAVFTKTRITEAVAQGLLTPDQFKQLSDYCQLDIINSGDDRLWAVNLAQIGQNWALETCADFPQPWPALCDDLKNKPAKCYWDAYSSLFSDSGKQFPCPPPRAICKAPRPQ